jgi:predicted glycoside hydrolase/deacetylase ChbG (UPF0249 family)
MTIVNADDFGYSSSVNLAIVRAFEDGLVTSTSVMATMPGFEEACEVARQRGFLAHVGVHLALTEGEPVTSEIRGCGRFCDPSGAFASQPGHLMWLRRSEAELAAQELRAQLARCRAHGIRPSHLDSHHHLHNDPPIGRIVVDLARAEGVSAVRIARNRGPGIGLPTRAYKGLFNRRLERLGLARTRSFGGVSDHVYERMRGASAAALADFEVMTHPILDEQGVLIDSESPGLELRRLLERLQPDVRAGSLAGAPGR